MSKGKIIQGLFNTQDDQLHRSMKKPIAGIYSMSNLVSFEPYVDSTISFFLGRLEEAKEKGNGKIDLGTWLQWFAFDVMGEITFSKRLGFLDEAKDVDGIMGSIWKMFQYSCWVSGSISTARLGFREVPPITNACVTGGSNAMAR